MTASESNRAAQLMPVKRPWLRPLIVAILALHVGLLAWSDYVHSPTCDEPMHLAGGLRHWQFGQFDIDRGNPPLLASLAALPVLLAKPATDWSHVPNSYIVGTDFAAANGSRVFTLVTLARLPCVLFSVLGALICYRWASDVYGPYAGLAALTLWCFDPFVLAHGALVTADIPAAALGMSACYLFRRWLFQGTWSAALTAGACLAAAEVTKYVWVVLYPLWPILWLIWTRLSPAQAARPQLRQLFLVLAIGVYGTNLAYLFAGSLAPVGAHPYLRQKVMDYLAAENPRGNALTRAVLAMPSPAPWDYVKGACEVTQLFEYEHRSYLRTLSVLYPPLVRQNDWRR